MTPRARAHSPEATRSLTDRRNSSASKTQAESPVAAPDAVEHAVVEEKEPADAKMDGTTDKKSSPAPAVNPPVDQISLADMDDVNLGEGQCYASTVSL
jgi:hypothetical protein